MAQQIDLPMAISKSGLQPPTDETLRKFLGYRWSPASDALAWRNKRILS